jgi:hypothetical protein
MSKLTESVIVFSVVYCVGRFAVNFGLRNETFTRSFGHMCRSAVVFGAIILLCVKFDSARKK